MRSMISNLKCGGEVKCVYWSIALQFIRLFSYLSKNITVILVIVKLEDVLEIVSF